MSKITIIGTTSWGKTLGIVLANKGQQVILWARTDREAAELRNGGSNSVLPFGITFPPRLSITSSLSEALDGAQALILAVPSQTMRQNIRLAKGYLNRSVLVVSAAKGLELGSNKRMSEVIAEEILPDFWSNICVLSGPNLSREIIRDLPAATVVAAEDEAVAQKAQRLLSTAKFCV